LFLEGAACFRIDRSYEDVHGSFLFVREYYVGKLLNNNAISYPGLL
jgi:hypothetical protein